MAYLTGVHKPTQTTVQLFRPLSVRAYLPYFVGSRVWPWRNLAVPRRGEVRSSALPVGYPILIPILSTHMWSSQGGVAVCTQPSLYQPPYLSGSPNCACSTSRLILVYGNCSTHTGDKSRLYAVDKNQPLYALYRTNNLCILHRFPGLLITRLISPVCELSHCTHQMSDPPRFKHQEGVVSMGRWATADKARCGAAPVCRAFWDSRSTDAVACSTAY
jgi:hypothetical protein